MARTKRGPITVPLRPDFRAHTIEKAVIYPEGLAVHKRVTHDGEEGKKWIITHVPTGYSFGTLYDTQRHAKKVVEKLIETGIYWRGKTHVTKITNEDKARALAVIELYLMDEPE